MLNLIIGMMIGTISGIFIAALFKRPERKCDTVQTFYALKDAYRDLKSKERRN